MKFHIFTCICGNYMFLQSEAVFFRLHHHLDISFLISPKLLYVVCFCLCDVFLSPNSFKLLRPSFPEVSFLFIVS